MSLTDRPHTRQRKKTWEQKVKLVEDSFERVKEHPLFARKFYDHLFFLNPKIKIYFNQTDFDHQEKALLHGLSFFLKFLDHTDLNARTQVLRLSKTHSGQGLAIHPHHYYYWIEAIIMTVRAQDDGWFDDLEFYWREVISLPVSFMVSQYFANPRDLA